MNWIKKKYYENRNGIILTLLFHIILFVVLNLTQFRTKKEYKETELLFDFPEEIIEQVQQIENNNKIVSSSELKTNVASNKSIAKTTEKIDKDFQQELEEARNLVKDVSSQLSKEIPTIEDLKMPEETSEGLDPDSIMKKLYTGESNVEYFLENRFHIRLPIPVYLAQVGGKVKVNILVSSNGRVIKAEPVIENHLSEQILSYAKTAALRTQFNSVGTDNQNQSGYIIYNFIAQ